MNMPSTTGVPAQAIMRRNMRSTTTCGVSWPRTARAKPLPLSPALLVLLLLAVGVGVVLAVAAAGVLAATALDVLTSSPAAWEVLGSALPAGCCCCCCSCSCVRRCCSLREGGPGRDDTLPRELTCRR
jgi:hypothetical protein